MHKLLWITCLVILSGFSAADEQFTLDVGESAVVEGTELSLTFVGVARDSRCPRDVNCIVAGEALVIFKVVHVGVETELEFKIGPGGSDEKKLDELTIAIVKLAPATDSTKKIDADDYTATVVVRQP